MGSKDKRNFRSLETYDVSFKARLLNMLKALGIYYELSGVGDGWHFEILCNKREQKNIDEWIDSDRGGYE